MLLSYFLVVKMSLRKIFHFNQLKKCYLVSSTSNHTSLLCPSFGVTVNVPSIITILVNGFVYHNGKYNT